MLAEAGSRIAKDYKEMTNPALMQGFEKQADLWPLRQEWLHPVGSGPTRAGAGARLGLAAWIRPCSRRICSRHDCAAPVSVRNHLTTRTVMRVSQNRIGCFTVLLRQLPMSSLRNSVTTSDGIPRLKQPCQREVFAAGRQIPAPRYLASDAALVGTRYLAGALINSAAAAQRHRLPSRPSRRCAWLVR